MAKLADCRRSLIAAGIPVRPFGPAYHAIHTVTVAIDSLATFITGQRYYFADGGPSNMPVRPDERNWPEEH